MKKKNICRLWNHKGYSLAIEGKYKEAIECFKKVLKIDNKNAIALINISNALGELNKFEDALKFIEKLIKIKPECIDAKITKAVLFKELRKPAEGIGILKKILQKHPNNFSAITKIGVLYNEIGNHEEALIWIEKALDLKPDHPETLLYKGIFLSDIKNFEESLKIFGKVLKIQPNNILALINKGVALSQMERYQKALEFYDKALAIDPENIIGLGNKGNALVKLGSHELAILNYKNALKLEPNNSFILINLAGSLINSENYDDALIYLEKIKNLRPDYSHCYIFFAILYLNLQEYEKADENFEDAKKYMKKVNNQDLLTEIENYQDITKNLIKLNFKLDDLDKNFKNLIQDENWYELKKYSPLFLQNISIIYDEFKDTNLPNSILDTLKAKEKCFRLVKNVLHLSKTTESDIEELRRIFKKHELKDYIQVIDNIQKLNHNILKYNGLRSFLEIKKEEIKFQLKNLARLNGDFTESIINTYKTKARPISCQIYSTSHFEINPIFFQIIESIDTKYSDSTNFIQNKLKENIHKLYTLSFENFKFFIEILMKIVTLMHLDSEQYSLLNELVDIFWEKNKEKKPLEMEKKWFQPRFLQILNPMFGDDIQKEPETTRGNVDFKIRKIPVELKVFHDRNHKKDSEKSGMILLKEYIGQAFQYIIHTKCGYLIGYDYRNDKINNEYKALAISERIDFSFKGEKVICSLLFQRLKRPSQNSKKS